MNLSRCVLGLWVAGITWLPSVTYAQETVARVSQVLPFAASGGVTTAEKATAAPEAGSPTSATAPASTSTVAQSGGTITTADDGAASLVIGTLGSARMGTNSEVKVPESGEGGHSLELLKGQLFLNISGEDLKQRAAGEFKLKTPAALLAVKGTKFFTVSKDGTDTVGVHEGSVEVQEPTSGKKITLTAGQAAEVSPGLLSSAREMTENEKTQVPEYDKATLIRTPMAMSVEYPKAKDRPSISWQKSDGLRTFGSQPQQTEQGGIRYVWIAQKDKSPGQFLRGYIGAPYKSTILDKLANKAFAISGRFRCKNVAKLEVEHLLEFFSTPKNSKPVSLTALPSDGSWTSIMIPLQVMIAADGKARIHTGLSIETFVDLPSDTGLSNKAASAIELQDFVFLSGP